MPTPRKGEPEKQYVSRCIPVVLKEGTAKDSSQAAAICHSLYKQHHKKSTKLAESASVLDGPISKPDLDTGRMSARFIFASSSLDRVGDVLNVAGIDTTAHQQNPVVLWDHGNWFADPIGRTVDPAGNYTVEIAGDKAYQTTFFLPTELGEQYYSLVEMGGINCNSIGYRATKKRQNSAGGFFLDEVELVEISLVAVPANADCIRAALSRDRLCGKSIHPSLRAALEAQLPTKSNIIVGGFTMGVIKAHKSLVKSAIASAKNQSAVATGAGGAVVPAPAQKAEPAPAPTPAPEEEVAVEETPKIPHGAEMLQSIYQHFCDFITYCDNEFPRMDNEEVAVEILDACEMVYEKLGSIADLYSAQYPDLEPLPEMVEPEEETTETEEVDGEEKDEEEEGAEEGEEEKSEGEDEGKGLTSALPGKSYSGSVKRLTKAMGNTIRECSEHLTEMQDADNLTSGQKLVCKHYSKELGAMCEDKAADGNAEIGEKDDEGGEMSEIEKEYDSLSPEEQKAFDSELATWVAKQEAAERRAALLS
jgi:HK97 family phage prohead protease